MKRTFRFSPPQDMHKSGWIEYHAVRGAGQVGSSRFPVRRSGLIQEEGIITWQLGDDELFVDAGGRTVAAHCQQHKRRTS
ncbi:MAG: hypothetical protein ACTFAK_11615 [Candidatus Electronema sp. VV]